MWAVATDTVAIVIFISTIPAKRFCSALYNPHSIDDLPLAWRWSRWIGQWTFGVGHRAGTERS